VAARPHVFDLFSQISSAEDVLIVSGGAVTAALAKDNPMTRAEVVAKAHDLITLRGRKKGPPFPAAFSWR